MKGTKRGYKKITNIELRKIKLEDVFKKISWTFLKPTNLSFLHLNCIINLL